MKITKMVLLVGGKKVPGVKIRVMLVFLTRELSNLKDLVLSPTNMFILMSLWTNTGKRMLRKLTRIHPQHF